MAEIEPGGPVADSEVFDVRDADAVDAAIARLTEAGALNAVVNAAGLARIAPFTEITPRGWQLMIDANLTGAFNVLRSAVPRMPDGGAIVLISSIDSTLPVSGLDHYCASQAGVDALARSAALELGPRGIRCNVVAPGVVRTPLMADEHQTETADQRGRDSLPHWQLGVVHPAGDRSGDPDTARRRLDDPGPL